MITLGSLASSRRWLMINAVLAALSIGFAASLVKEVTVPSRLPAPDRPNTLVSVDHAANVSTVGRYPAYSMIASRNLFSPTRTDTQSADAASTIPLNLVGVALAGERSLAFLEDPATKRVQTYRIGDVLAGGIIRTIEETRIVLEWSHRRLDVQLHDPSRPTYGAQVSGPPAGTSDGETPRRFSSIAGSTVPPITLESLPQTFGPGPTPANATSDDLSLR